MRFGGEPGFAQDNGATFEVGERERAHQQCQFCRRKPGKSRQAAQVVEVGGTSGFGFIQFRTMRMMSQYTLLRAREKLRLPAGQKQSTGKNLRKCAREPNR